MTCEAILTDDSEMKHVSTKFVPWLLVREQKENWLSVTSDLLECAENNEHFLKIYCNRWWNMGLQVRPS